MKTARLCLLVSLSLPLGACLFGGGGPEVPVDTVRPAPASAVIFQTDRLVVGDSTRMVVRDAESWNELWSLATSREPSAQLDRAMDFSNEMVLVAAAGRMDTGAQIRFDSVGVRGDRFIANVVTTVDCGGFRSDVYPIMMVRVTRSELPVRWLERREQTARCN